MQHSHSPYEWCDILAGETRLGCLLGRSIHPRLKYFQKLFVPSMCVAAIFQLGRPEGQVKLALSFGFVVLSVHNPFRLQSHSILVTQPIRQYLGALPAVSFTRLIFHGPVLLELRKLTQPFALMGCTDKLEAGVGPLHILGRLFVESSSNVLHNQSPRGRMIERTKFLAAIDGTQIKHFRDAVCNVIEQIGAGRVSQINQSDEMLYSALRIVTRDLRMWSYWPQAALVRFEAWRKEFDAAVERAGLLDQGVFDQELEDFATLDDPAKRDEFRRAIEATADTALVKGCHRTAIADVLLETAVEIQMSKIGYGHLWFENAEEELKHCASMHEVAAGSLTKFLDKLDANPDDQTRS